MFALIKYGVGCTLSIKQMLLDWSRKLVPRHGVAGLSTGCPDLFCLSSCFCMGVHARGFRTGTPDACRLVAFVGAGRDGAHWVGGQVSLVFVGFARWLPRAFRSLVFVGFVHIFATARWLPLKQIFRRVFSFLAYLSMQRSSPAIFLIQNHNQPSTLARMAGLDLNGPLEEEAYTPGND